MERHVVCKGELVNVYRVLVWKGMWCVRREWVNVYRLLVWKGMLCNRGEWVNVYSVLVRIEVHGRPNFGWETILKFFLNKLIFYVKKILNSLCDLDFVAEDRDR